MLQPQRDPAEYRRRKQERILARVRQAHDVAAQARSAAIKDTIEVRKCYEEYLPPQVQHAFEMITCAGVSVSPRRVRGTSCLTALGEDVVRRGLVGNA